MMKTSAITPLLLPNRVEILGYGEFFGTFACRRDLQKFSLALVAPDVHRMKAIRHTHTDSHVIFSFGGNYVLSSGRRDRVLPPNSTIFVPAGTTHQNFPQTPRTQILAITVSESQIKEAQQHARLPEMEMDFQHGDIRFLVNRLRVECADWGSTSPLTAAGLCLEILGSVAGRTQPLESVPPRWLETAREMLQDRCGESVRIAEVADEAGVHPIHLCRTFRRFFHCTPGEYLRSCRLERAAALLRQRSLPLAHVAIDSGFSDQSEMCKAFRRKFGTTPRRFRDAVLDRASN